MEETTSPESARGIRGLVHGVPGNSPVPNTLLRFFEIPRGRTRARIDPEWIVREGVPVGSVLTDDKGRFTLSYCRPNQDTSLAFVAFGPETGTRCEVLSWSFEPRIVSNPEETFFIGVEEARLGRALTQEASPKLKELIKLAQARAPTALKRPKVRPTDERLANLTWSSPSKFEEIKSPQEKLVEIDSDPDSARTLNAKLLKESYQTHLRDTKRKFAGASWPTGTAARRRVDKKLQKRAKATFGLASENLHSEVASIVDRLRPLIAARRARLRVAATGGSKKAVALVSTPPPPEAADTRKAQPSKGKSTKAPQLTPQKPERAVSKKALKPRRSKKKKS